MVVKPTNTLNMKKTIIAFIILVALTLMVLLSAAVLGVGHPVSEQLSTFALTVLIPACVACTPWNTQVNSETDGKSATVDTKPLVAAAARGVFRLLFRRKR